MSEATTPPYEPGDLLEVWVDPRDGTHLLLKLMPCVADDAAASAAETATEVAISINAAQADRPCNGELVDLFLDAPLAGRRVTDADDRDRKFTVLPLNGLYPDPSTLVTAECTTEAADAAVEHDIDGGLRSKMLSCDGTWMAVETSTNACPATGEAPDDACIANVHIAYFRNDDGYWSIVAFTCTDARAESADFPDSICRD